MISAMPEGYLDDEDDAEEEYEEQAEPEEYTEPKPDPFATSSFSARTIKGAYENRFTDLQFGQNNAEAGNNTTEKEEL